MNQTELFGRENVPVLAKIQITGKNKVKFSLRQRPNQKVITQQAT